MDEKLGIFITLSDNEEYHVVFVEEKNQTLPQMFFFFISINKIKKIKIHVSITDNFFLTFERDGFKTSTAIQHAYFKKAEQKIRCIYSI
ncbi:hypothetical protein EGR_06285 [Echinococcus granulosus]|uniref:Uncharacterized protein n=1 Tax=Echinococcus granulosus TaxID=6210 RepID=W6UDG9_ECHGR|nr:hypothetical protein EGR_06285 [Echinococcus granulosus]EUB58861.1 hypothetical protein EGR_06285 [Echinococcus granulosus]